MKKIILTLFGITILFGLIGCSNTNSSITKTANDCPPGSTVPQGTKGDKGDKGDKGEDGHSPVITIGENGNWFIDGVDTNVYAGERKEEKVDTSTNEIKEYDIITMVPESMVPQYSVIFPDAIPADYESGDLLISSSQMGEDNIQLLFNSEFPSIPFVELERYVEYVNENCKRQITDPTTGEITYDHPAIYSYLDGVGRYVLAHPNGSMTEAIFDINKQEITTKNIDGLCVSVNTNCSIFHNSLGTTLPKESIESFQYYKFLENDDIYFDGDYCSISLTDYNTIKLVENGGKLYLPLQTANDLFNPPTYMYFNGYAVYNAIGNNILNSDSTGLNILGLDMKNKDNRTDSEKEDLYEHTYDELCFILDSKYGLKDTHNFTKADELLSKTPVKGEILNGKISEGISDLVNVYLEDNGHSTFKSAGYLEEIGDYFQDSLSNKAYMERGRRYINAGIDAGIIDDTTKKFVTPISIVDNTMYIMFSGFKTNTTGIHYQVPNPFYNASEELIDLADLSPEQLDILANDNIYLMSYATAYANSHDEIKNIVLDLSINTGGQIDAALAVIGGMLGDSAFTYFRNPNNSSSCVTKFYADLNFDEKFDENDYFNDKKLYCLTSSISFSCGNLVPAVFKSSGKVTLVGRQTGGGSCLVLNCSTLFAGNFSLSSSVRMYGYMNGAPVDVEFGVDPDILLDTEMEFYDRGPTSTLGKLFS